MKIRPRPLLLPRLGGRDGLYERIFARGKAAQVGSRYMARRGPAEVVASEFVSEKRRKIFGAAPWPTFSLAGPGGHRDAFNPGTKKLRELAGDPSSIEAVFSCTMGLNATWLLEEALGLSQGTDIPIVIACHHP